VDFGQSGPSRAGPAEEHAGIIGKRNFGMVIEACPKKSLLGCGFFSGRRFARLRFSPIA
jgi:hypothetical protein